MTSALREPLVLPDDVVLSPVAMLPGELRNKIGGQAGDFTISRPMARETSKLIDANAAALLENFRTARTIVQAVLAYSRERELDAEKTLEEALPMLRQLVAIGLLVPQSSDQAEPISATWQRGALFAGYRVLQCVHILDDTELYQARSNKGAFVALKIARQGQEAALGPRLGREAAALQRLDGTVNPLLLEAGEAHGRPFLALAWRQGVDAATAAAQVRAPRDRAELLRLLTNIARAYAMLHRQGCVHGDVHARNILVDRDGAVTLIDYGFAEFESGDQGLPNRGGVSFFFEPEWARALLSAQAPPKATAKGEQYSVAALLYSLATGHHYVDFNLQSERMLRQIAELPPLPFENTGAEPWPELENALARALTKRPELRYPDMDAFADALADIVAAVPAAPVVQHGAARTLLGTMLEDLRPDRPLFREGLPAGPVCSANLGAAGIAYALYRLACIRDDSELLAAATIWITRALRDQNRVDAFANPEIEMTPEIAGNVSPYHSAAGVQLVRALIAYATGDSGELTAALSAFVATSKQPCANRDLTLGRCGTVLGCALLLEAEPDRAGAPAELLLALGRERLIEIWDEVDRFGPLEDCEQWPNLGIAHGWAGLLYTTLRWHVVARDELPPHLVDRLTQLIDSALPTGRGLSIPWREGLGENSGTMPGWCNGTAGLVHLGCLARRVIGEDAHLALAEGAAWDAWEAGGELVNLCCGLAGRAYGLIALHQLTGDAAWLKRAKTLAHDAARLAPEQRNPEQPRHSLYKGELGLTLLLAELERPATACMPLFGEEG